MSKKTVEAIEKYGLSKKSKKKNLFSQIGIIGCGKEGQNIARIAAFSGVEVIFIELSEELITRARRKIEEELDRRIESWGLTENEKKVILGRINGSLEYSALKDCDFVIESVRADERTGRRSIETRKEIFRKVESIVPKKTIIATNATTVVITELASELEHPERCISLHFYESSHEAKLVEVVKGIYTSDETYEKVRLFAKLMKRDVIDVAESVGLVSVRMMIIQINEACHIIMERVASVEDVDKSVTIGFGSRLGILHLADIIGLEKVMKWMENLFEEFGDDKYKPSPIIRRLVRAKQTGVNAGRGFYAYDKESRKQEVNVTLR